MQFRYFPAVTMILVCAGFVPVEPARADTVLYDGAGFIQGSQSFVQSFNITAPGTLTISLADVPWLDTIADLNCFLTTASGVLGTSMGGGTESMRVGAGTFYAHWFGDADGRYDLGVYSLKIMFHPDVNTVPLPRSLSLLLSGLGLLFFGRLRRAAAFLFALAWSWGLPRDGAGEPAAVA
jgi:hypothetical protein